MTIRSLMSAVSFGVMALWSATSFAATASVTIPITIRPAGALASDEEFVGPFASWMCARSAASGTCGMAGTGPGSAYYNATGNGATDDTMAVQSCISALTPTHPVCYFPSGTYKVSSTLTLNGISGCSTTCEGYALTGHDPSDTKLLWAGGSGGILLSLDGVRWGRFSRITFDGGGLAGILVDESSASVATFGNLFADDVFTNGLLGSAVGYRCGKLNNLQCSEIEITRSTFNNLYNGVTVCNANAVNIWVWYSTFNSNAHALGANCQDDLHGGGINAAHNIFNNSSAEDYFGYTLNPAALLDNYSSGSNQFLNSGGFMLLQRNTVVNPTQTIAVYNNGPTVAFDNVIKSSGTGPPLQGARLFSMGNTYSITNIEAEYSFGDTTNPTIADPTPPTMPGSPPNNNRTIYEASPSGTNNSTCSVAQPCTVQAAVCMAATGSNGFAAGNCTGTVNSSKNVAHLQAGTYTISAIISVPANSNAQIVGDHWWFTLLNGGSAVSAVFRVNGPSSVVLRDLWIGPSASQDGIELSAMDYSGGKIWMDAFYTIYATTAVFLDNINQTAVEAHNLQYPGPGGTGLLQTGSGIFDIFFGLTYQGYQDAAISNGAKFQRVGLWQDSYVQSGFASISGSGTFTEAASFISAPPPAGGSGPAFTFNNYTGKAAVLADLIIPSGCADKSTITGALNSGQLAVALTRETGGGGSSYITATGTTIEAFGNRSYNSDCSNHDLTDTVNGVPSAPDATFINTMFPAAGHLRATPPSLPRSGDIQLHRVYIYAPRYGIHVIP